MRIHSPWGKERNMVRAARVKKIISRIFTTHAIEEIVIELLGELVRRTHNQLDDRIYEIVINSKYDQD